jgi:hypothetical protein
MCARLGGERLKQHCYWHALPVGWEQLGYDEFLEKRRRLIARVVRDAFQTLYPASGSEAARVAAATRTHELIAAGESLNVEFKSSARWSYKGRVHDPKLEHVIVKTIAGLMNAEGGTLLIGVDDNGRVLGLDPDYRTLGKPNQDGYELFLTQLLDANLSGAALALARISFSKVDDKDVCRVDVAASAHPVFTVRSMASSTPSSGRGSATAPGSWSAPTWRSTNANIGDSGILDAPASRRPSSACALWGRSVRVLAGPCRAARRERRGLR